MISLKCISTVLDATKHQNLYALIIRTVSNLESKKNKNYFKINSPYLAEEAAIFIRENGIQSVMKNAPEAAVDDKTIEA